MSVAAVLQMTSAPDVSENLATARNLLERARAQGAVLAALPENFAIMGRKETDKLEAGEAFGEGPIQAFLSHSWYVRIQGLPDQLAHAAESGVVCSRWPIFHQARPDLLPSLLLGF